VTRQANADSLVSMSERVAVVTDSTAYLPDEMSAEYGILTVPVQVVVSGNAYREGVDISTAEVAAALADWQMVTTSRPSPGDFAEIFQQAATAGATSIVSVHLSSDLSGTYQTAILAASDSPIPVTVVDSRTLAMSLGFACIAGARAARNGADRRTVAREVSRVALGSKCFFYVDTLEYLRRGGRMGKTAAAFGTAFRVKPILHVEDGQVSMLEKARTCSKALARLQDLAVQAAQGESVDIAVQHIGAPDQAAQLARELASRLDGIDILETEIGAVVGAHVGPGMVSVALAPKASDAVPAIS